MCKQLIFFWNSCCELQLHLVSAPPTQHKKKMVLYSEEPLCPKTSRANASTDVYVQSQVRARTHIHTLTHAYTQLKKPLYLTPGCATLQTLTPLCTSQRLLVGPLRIQIQSQTKFSLYFSPQISRGIQSIFTTDGPCRPQQRERSTKCWSVTIWASLPTNK